LKDIHRLQPDELSRVWRAVEARLTTPNPGDEEEAFLNALLNSGLVSEIKRPVRAGKHDRPPVPIHGKPLSETIVEERR